MPSLRFPEFRNSPAWQTLTADLLFEPINERGATPGLPVLAVTQDYGAIPRDLIGYHVSVAAESVANYKEVREGDFIISLRSFQGGIEYSRYHGICSPAYVVLRRRGEGSDEFFRHLFKSAAFIRQLTRNVEGIRDGKMISYSQFSEQLLCVPEPPEQHKIAACLGAVDDLLSAEARKLETLRQHRQGMIHQLFPEPGETAPRLRFPEFSGAHEWNLSSVGAVFETTSGGTPDRGRAEYWDGTVPWVTTSAVDFNVIDSAQELITEAGLANSSAKVFPRGTVLIAMYGQGKTRGKAAILGIDAATNQACAALLPNPEIDSRYVLGYLASRYDDIRSISNSGSQDNLSQALIRDLPFVYPRDRAEQQRIADCLSSIDAYLIMQLRKLDALEKHKQALSAKMR